MVNKIPAWSMPILWGLKAKADSIWHMSDTIHYVSNISKWEGRLHIELGPKDREDIPGSFYWYSIGYVVPVPDKQEFEYMVKYTNEVYVYVNSWDELISTLESDLKEYNQKMLKALQKNLERDIDSLPG